MKQQVDSIQGNGFLVKIIMNPHNQQSSVAVDTKTTYYFFPLDYTLKDKLLDSFEKYKNSFKEELFLICNNDDLLDVNGLSRFTLKDCGKIDSTLGSKSSIYFENESAQFNVLYMEATWIVFSISKKQKQWMVFNGVPNLDENLEWYKAYYPFKVSKIQQIPRIK